MGLLIMYLCTALLWGIFCIRMQNKIYGGPLWKYGLCLTLNFIFWPISMIIAIARCPVVPLAKKPTENPRKSGDIYA